MYLLGVSGVKDPIRRILQFRRRRNAIKVPAISKRRINSGRVRYFAILAARSVEVACPAHEAGRAKVGCELIAVRNFVVVSIRTSYRTSHFFTRPIPNGMSGRMDKLLTMANRRSCGGRYWGNDVFLRVRLVFDA